MSNFKDLTGCTFNGLTVLERTANNKYGSAVWICKCNFCGNKCTKTTSQLNSNKTYSCGCKQLELHNEKIRRFNEYTLNKNTVIVKLTNSDKCFICDPDDWIKAKDYCWSLHHTGYVYTTIKSKYITFHNFIFSNKLKELQVDHINLDTLNNKKDNLRVVTVSQNMINRNKFINNTSGHTGVHYNKNNDKWVARIQIDNKRIVLGSFIFMSDAIKAREDAEIKYFGEYRRNVK